MFIVKKAVIIVGITIFLTNCISLVEKTGRLLDGSAFNEKIISVYRASEKDGAPSDMNISIIEDKNGDKSIIIGLDRYPMINLHGTFPNEDGQFYFTSLEYLAGNTHGWNEFSLQLLGSGSLLIGERAVLEVTDEIIPIQISSGRIHRYDTRLTGDNALTLLRNRRERIIALTEWMVSLNTQELHSIDLFNDYWKPILFPEMVPRRKRPLDWKLNNDIFEKGEDIKWNTGYTERIFTQELWAVRNSGTLLRDWEEALSWIYYEYEWKKILGFFSNQVNLIIFK